MGAKHDAQRDTASGFCICNDMAVAAKELAASGLKVPYIDWDAHHGDGVEFLLEQVPQAMTAEHPQRSHRPGDRSATPTRSDRVQLATALRLRRPGDARRTKWAVGLESGVRSRRRAPRGGR